MATKNSALHATRADEVRTCRETQVQAWHARYPAMLVAQEASQPPTGMNMALSGVQELQTQNLLCQAWEVGVESQGV